MLEHLNCFAEKKEKQAKWLCIKDDQSAQPTIENSPALQCWGSQQNVLESVKRTAEDFRKPLNQSSGSRTLSVIYARFPALKCCAIVSRPFHGLRREIVSASQQGHFCKADYSRKGSALLRPAELCFVAESETLPVTDET
ncbi:MAG TPA: hypothetical protein VK582_10915 [Pyrinomonadaceae bacterium]|nr:hypothetical protein [Pyrinomonadaceae bacterium]